MLDYFSLIVKKNPTKTINKKAYELNLLSLPVMMSIIKD